MPELTQLCERVDKMELAFEEHEQRLDEFHVALTENTVMTRKGLELAERSIAINQTTADNTSELVDIFKGAKAFRKFMLWLVGLGVGVGVPIWAFFEFIWRHYH